MRATILALAAGLAMATTALGDEPLQGQWIAISAEENGAAADLVGHRLTFDGDHFRIVDTEGEVVNEGTFSLDPGASPATIDFAGSAVGGAWAGIWKHDGTLLTIVDNAPDPKKPRPGAFAAPVGSGYVMVVFTPWK